MSECFGTMLTPKRLLARVGPQVDLDVGLVQEGPVALGAVVHGLVVGVVAVPAVATAAHGIETHLGGGAAEVDPATPIAPAAIGLTHFGPHFFAVGFDGAGAGEVT